MFVVVDKVPDSKKLTLTQKRNIVEFMRDLPPDVCIAAWKTLGDGNEDFSRKREILKGYKTKERMVIGKDEDGNDIVKEPGDKVGAGEILMSIVNPDNFDMNKVFGQASDNNDDAADSDADQPADESNDDSGSDNDSNKS
jgi:hypothetical protein